MPSLKTFRQMSGLPDSIRRWKDAAEQVKAGQQALVDQARGMPSAPGAGDRKGVIGAATPADTGSSGADGRERPAPDTETGMRADEGLTVDWRSVAYNAPSRSMPRKTPWVHGLIRDSKGPSPRIQLAPQKGGGVIDLLFAHPDQAAAEVMDWDRGEDMVVDGHTVHVTKSMTVASDWLGCEGDENGLIWQVRAALPPDHPLVTAAAQAAEGPQAALDKAEADFAEYAREWMGKNFPHPDFMNVVRDLELSEWKHRPEYWPGDPMPDADELLNKARERLAR